MSKRRKRGAFNLPAIRRGEIERDARDVGAAETEDFWRWLVAWCWHNEQNTGDPVGALIMAAGRMGRRNMTETEVEAILERAKAMRQRRSADALGRFLGVTYARRQRLGHTTTGSVDVRKQTRAVLRMRRRRLYWERRRRSRGARPRAEALTRTKPWEAEGMSRATWYRRRETSPQPAIAPLKSGGTNETSSQPAIFSYAECVLVSPERKQGPSEEGVYPKSTEQTLSPTSLVLEGGVLLTRRWIAAREKASPQPTAVFGPVPGGGRMMTVAMNGEGWAVVDGFGRVLADGFKSNASAWRWIDRQAGDPISRAEGVSEWIWSKNLDPFRGR
jgi:hypothetical protein